MSNQTNLRLCDCGAAATNVKGNPRCDQCLRDRKNQLRRDWREAQKAARPSRACACGQPASSDYGRAVCLDCIAKGRREHYEKLREITASRSGPKKCRRCNEDLPYDPEKPKALIHEACRSIVPASQLPEHRRKGERMCGTCGINPARNAMGKAVCNECSPKGETKFRQCECGKHFKTRNNSTRCNGCSTQRKKELVDRRCIKCGTLIDPRARNCAHCPSRRDRANTKPVGSRRKISHGYVEIKTDKGWLREHVHVMEEKMGRRLVPGENVHHLNGVRDDNRIENLELWCTQQPNGARARDLLEWAREIVARYGNEDL